MQKFTRALTREIEVGGERLAVTLSEQGLEVRPVGSRRPPHAVSWAALVCACAGHPPAEPTAEDVTAALQALKAGGGAKSADAGAKEKADTPAEKSAEAGAQKPAEGELPALLRRIDQWLAAHRKRFHPALLPGASEEELEKLGKALGAPVPEELLTWLRWHDGQSADVIGAFEGGWNLMSARQIIEAKKELDADAHQGWNKSWIPFLDDDRGDYLVLAPGDAGVPVRECWRGQAEHAVVAPSLTAWVKDFVTALERGDYHEDPERGTFSRKE